ncbi:MAG: hypothetical protein ABI861_11870 [Panacibacter sp.]
MKNEKSINRAIVLFTFTIFQTFILIKGNAQTFKVESDENINEKRVKYYNRDAGLIIHKIVSGDTMNPIYEIGLSISRTSLPSDYFMFKGSYIFFNDSSIMKFNNEIDATYTYPGKHELVLLHILTEEEFKILQTKKIKYFKIGDETSTLDKWQPLNIIKAFNEIISQE